MEYIKIENGIMTELISTNDPPAGDQWRAVGGQFQGGIGMDERLLDWESGLLRPDEDLAAEGLIEDNRGPIWHTQTMQRREIRHLGEAAPENYTASPPPENPDEQAFCEWDGTAWKVDREAMAQSGLKNHLMEHQQYLSETDWYVTRQAETGQAIPDEVAEKRRAAREAIDQLRQKVQ